MKTKLKLILTCAVIAFFFAIAASCATTSGTTGNNDTGSGKDGDLESGR